MSFRRFINAVKLDDVDAMEDLFMENFLHTGSRHGWRPLHIAAICGHLDAAQFLIDRGAKVNAVDREGWRPIHYAARWGHANLVRLFIKCGANIELDGKWICRPIHLACESGHANVLKMLLSAGCLTDKKDSYDLTPLDRALLSHKNEAVECVRMLIVSQVSRGKTEYKIIHLSTFSIVCREYKIYDLMGTWSKIKEMVSPVNRHVVICNLSNPMRCQSSEMATYRLISPELRYTEYFAVNRDTDDETIKSIIKSLRDWDVDATINRSDQIIELRIKSLSHQTNWRRHFSIHLDLCNDPCQSPMKSMDIMALESIKGDVIKGIFIDTMVLHCRGYVYAAMERCFLGKTYANRWFNRLLQTRKEMLTFYNKRREKISNSKDLTMTNIGANCRISVVQKPARDIHCIPQLSNIFWTKQFISKITSEEYILIRCVTDDGTDWALPRHTCRTAGNIKEKLTRIISANASLWLVGSEGVLPDETNIENIGSVIHYAVVFPYENVDELSNIGKGGYGTVLKCKMKNSVAIFAVKRIDVFENREGMSKEDIISEIMVFARIGSHPNVMKYHHFYESKIGFYIAMDYMEETLYHHVKEKHPLPEEKIISFTKQILDGLKHLHDQKIIHRDIKCRNVLLDKNQFARLSDFGISKCQNVDTEKVSMEGGNTQKGTFRYMAPELHLTNSDDHNPSHGQKVDIWSFGALIIEIITSRPPYPDNPDPGAALRIYRERKIEYEHPSHYSSMLKSFVDVCLTADPAKRPNCAKLLRHPVFRRSQGNN